jgi:hypothetical protein
LNFSDIGGVGISAGAMRQPVWQPAFVMAGLDPAIHVFLL